MPGQASKQPNKGKAGKNLAPSALTFLAAINPASINKDARTVELIWYTGALVKRVNWSTGQNYWLKMDLAPSAVRLGRLNNGGPFLDSHQSWELANVLGVVVPGSAKVDGKEGRATIKFSKRADVEPFFQDIIDGIIQNVSVGFDTLAHKEEEGGPNGWPIRTATDWEPYEISGVPMGADAGAGFLSHETAESFLNELEKRGVKFPAKENKEMTPEELAAQKAKEEKEAKEKADKEAAEKLAKEAASAERLAAETAERTRCAGILEACSATGLDHAVGQRLIRMGTGLDQARAEILAEAAKRTDANGQRTQIEVMAAGDEKLHASVENALLHRADPNKTKLEAGRDFRGMTLLEIAKHILAHRGHSLVGKSKMEIAKLAFASSSDFPIILANVANKTLRAAYETAPRTFLPFTRRATASDFKTITRTQFGEAPKLELVEEGGEYKYGTPGEAKEQYQLATYGKIVAVTRQVIINDDLGAFTRIPSLIGQAIADLESDTVWGIITANAAMGDNVTLFHSTHANYDEGAGTVLSAVNIGIGRKKMRLQKGLDGKQLLNLTPAFLIIPATLEMTAAQIVAQIVANATGSVVPDFIRSLNVLTEPRLDANSVTAWYLAANPAAIDTVEYAYLDGQDGPAVEQRVGFEVDGLEIKYRLDFAAKALDHRGLYKSKGAA